MRTPIMDARVKPAHDGGKGSRAMAHVKKGQLTAIHEWRKHLRFWKQVFGDPSVEKRDAKQEKKRKPGPRAGLLIFRMPQ